MKSFFAVFLLLPFILFSQNQIYELDYCCKAKMNKNHIHFISSGAGSEYDVNYHRCEWLIDPAIYFIEGKITTYFTPIIPTTEISFDMDSSLIVDSVFYQDNPITFSKKNNRLNLNFSEYLYAGKMDSVAIYYHGVPSATGFGSFTQAWHNNIPIIWTLSEPYGAMQWWPCKQTLSDKIDSIDIFVTSPPEYRTASNGKLIKDSTNGIWRINHWRHRYPIATYLVAFAVTNYAIDTNYVQLINGDSLPVMHYLYSETAPSFQSKIAYTPTLINMFKDFYTDYPFEKEKYGHAQISWSGGMEHQTMSFMGNLSWDLQAHELAHQWFGDFITCGSWEDIFLNEGFAVYSNLISYEPLNKTSFLNRIKILNEDIRRQTNGSVWCDDTTSVSRIFDRRLTYNKGGLLLHMIRWEIGDDAFFQSVKNYLNDTKLQNNFARINDLIKHFNSTADTNLNEFFNDWYYGQGYPSYFIEWSQDISGLLSISVNQTQSHESVDFFEMHLPIVAYGHNFEINSEQRIIVHNTYNDQSFSVKTDFIVDSIKFNKDYWIIADIDTIIEKKIISLDSEIIITPNPTRDNVYIKFLDFFSSENVKISVYSQTGELLINESFSLTNNIINIELPDNQGIYFLLLKTMQQDISKKIVKL